MWPRRGRRREPIPLGPPLLATLETEGGSTLAILVFLHGLLGKTATAGIFAGPGMASVGVGIWKWRRNHP